MVWPLSSSSKTISDAGQEISTLTLLLCLFIMLLAFFIVVASHATYRDDKVTEVLQSVDQVFAGRVFRDGPGPSMSEQPDHGSGQGQEMERLEALFRARIPGAEIRRIPDRGILSVEMTRDKFTKILDEPSTSDSASPAQDGGLSALMTPSKGMALQMEIWMIAAGDPLQDTPQQRTERLRTLSDWAKALEARGVSSGRITIGLQAGDKERVQLLFRPFVPYAPLAQKATP
jgi:hypothetical protein